MARIKVLPENLCNQIAAGEVVERPAAVVKELVENSLDASARKISIHVLKGGRSEVRVTDDGCGMSPDDALLALERHATSKIHTVRDLQAVRTLGFRGEALPSIAAVSRFEMITREREAVSATRIQVEGGTLCGVEETGAPPGTTITVRDLFFNLPARRKFLRSPDTEWAHVVDLVFRQALAHPQVHFQLNHPGRRSYDFPKSADLAQRAAQVLGHQTARALIPVEAEGSTVRIRGLLGPPELHRSNTRSLFLFVNHRPVKDKLLHHALLSAYDTLVPKGRYPVAVLFVDLPPELVDVNVHPTKREVRFRRPSQVLEAVRGAAGEALSRTRRAGWNRPLADPRQLLDSTRPYLLRETQTTPSPAFAAEAPAPAKGEEPPAPDFKGAQMSFPGTDSPTGLSRREPENEAEGSGLAFSNLRILGQLAASYILLEAPDGLVIIDQHAAHERICFDRLCERERPVLSQRLTRPAVVELLPLEAEALNRWLPELEASGFEIEPFGGHSFVVHAVPAVLGGVDPAEILRTAAEATPRDEKAPKLDLLSRLAKTAACHGSVRAGQKLSHDEIRRLLEDLDRSRLPGTCPHGRPLWWKISTKEIERYFHRN